jgi:hypothetical protein
LDPHLGRECPKFSGEILIFHDQSCSGRLAFCDCKRLGWRPRQEFPAADWIAVFAILARGSRLRPQPA